jgi:hypothetical protein
MAETQVQRRPGRAAFWGFLLGLGVVIYLTFVWPVIALDNWTTVAVKAVIVIVVVMFVSILWGIYGPAKRPRGMAPAETPPPAAPGSEWLDDSPPPAPEADSPPPAPDEDDTPPPPLESY